MFRNSYDTGARVSHRQPRSRLCGVVPLPLELSWSLTPAPRADVTTWSPQGRLFQIECASAAVAAAMELPSQRGGL